MFKENEDIESNTLLEQLGKIYRNQQSVESILASYSNNDGFDVNTILRLIELGITHGYSAEIYILLEHLDKSKQIDLKDPYQARIIPMIQAVTGNLNKIKQFYKNQKIDVSGIKTVLILAAGSGNPAITDYILKIIKSKLPDKLFKEYSTAALVEAARNGKINVVETLLNTLGKELEKVTGEPGQTFQPDRTKIFDESKTGDIRTNEGNFYRALRAAAANGQKELVYSLCNNININIKNYKDSPIDPLYLALLEAANHGQRKLVADILNQHYNEKFDLSVVLIMAVRENHLAVVKELLNHQPRLNLDINKPHQTPYESQAPYIKGTPLMVATEHASLDIVNELLKYPGIDINKAYYNKNPLHCAIHAQRKDIMEVLLNNHATKIEESQKNADLSKHRIKPMIRKQFNRLNQKISIRKFSNKAKNVASKLISRLKPKEYHHFHQFDDIHTEIQSTSSNDSPPTKTKNHKNGSRTL